MLRIKHSALPHSVDFATGYQTIGCRRGITDACNPDEILHASCSYDEVDLRDISNLFWSGGWQIK